MHYGSRLIDIYEKAVVVLTYNAKLSGRRSRSALSAVLGAGDNNVDESTRNCNEAGRSSASVRRTLHRRRKAEKYESTHQIARLDAMTTERRFVLRDLSTWCECLDYLMALRDRDVKLDVRVKPYSKKRSTSANAFYHACVVEPLAKFCGYSHDEMHTELLGAYCGWESRAFNGHVREFPRRRSTTPDTMETMDFAGLIETGQRIAAEMGVILPDQERAE